MRDHTPSAGSLRTCASPSSSAVSRWASAASKRPRLVRPSTARCCSQTSGLEEQGEDAQLKEKAAALQGVAKMRHNMALGLAQGFLLPLPRPNGRFMAAIGADGSEDRRLLAASWSALASVSPSIAQIRIIRPGPISPVTLPSTVTEARLTR